MRFYSPRRGFFFRVATATSEQHVAWAVAAAAVAVAVLAVTGNLPQ